MLQCWYLSAAAEAGVALLRFLAPGGTVTREHGLAHRCTTIGRGFGNVVPIPDDRAASLRHAVIKRTPYGYLLEDQGSANGTWVNGTRIDERHLRDGDEIRIGRSIIQFSTDSPSTTESGRST